MFDMRAHRTPREAQERLEQLIAQAPAAPAEPPDDQEWTDVSPPAPAAAPWWRRGGPGRLIERWPPGGAGAVAVRRRLPAALVIGIVLAAAVAIGVALSANGGRELPPALPAAHTSSVPPTRGDSSIVVSVIGRVAHPGLVTIPDGARVADALRAAGGPLPDVDIGTLNLARRLADGEQIAVGVPPPPTEPALGAPAGRLDLNSAALSQLDTLPGVGTVTAQRILDWRTQHGRFTSIDQLREVDGIGPARFNQLKNLVVVR